MLSQQEPKEGTQPSALETPKRPSNDNSRDEILDKSLRSSTDSSTDKMLYFHESWIFSFLQSSKSRPRLIVIGEEHNTTHSELLVWSSFCDSEINIIELDTKQNYAKFSGAQIIRGIFSKCRIIQAIQN